MKSTALSLLLLVISLFYSIALNSQVRLITQRTESILYLGKGKKQPLIVGLGGSEGGNAWTSDYWKKTRDRFLDSGYAFLAIGYFKAPGTPDTLDRIAIEDIHAAIEAACRNKKVNRKKIAIIGGSRGADLALLLASHYSDIRAVVSIVGSNAVFPGHTMHYSTSSFTYQGKEFPFVPVNDAAVPFLMKRNLRGAFQAMLADSVAAERAAIPVERIKGPVLFLSATQDEICPSTPMADAMVNRLKQQAFPYFYEHTAIEGRHAAPLKHFDRVFDFLYHHFR